MAATISQIRDALKAALATVSGLEVHDTVPGQITPPAAVVWRLSGPRPSTLGSATFDYTFKVTMLLSISDETGGQDDLDTYLTPTGASSVIRAIDDSMTLPDIVEYAQVQDVERDQVIEYAGASYLSADILVLVGSD